MNPFTSEAVPRCAVCDRAQQHLTPVDDAQVCDDCLQEAQEVAAEHQPDRTFLRFNIGHVITIIVVIASLVYQASKMNERISEIQFEQLRQHHP